MAEPYEQETRTQFAGPGPTLQGAGGSVERVEVRYSLIHNDIEASRPPGPARGGVANSISL